MLPCTEQKIRIAHQTALFGPYSNFAALLKSFLIKVMDSLQFAVVDATQLVNGPDYPSRDPIASSGGIYWYMCASLTWAMIFHAQYCGILVVIALADVSLGLYRFYRKISFA